MDATNHALPDNVEELKAVINQLIENERLACAFQEFQRKYEELEQKCRQLQKLVFGRKSEKLSPVDAQQGLLFNEAESFVDASGDGAGADETANEPNADADTTVVKQYTRKKAGRKPIPAHIPRKEILHDLSEEEKRCECCGKDRPKIGVETTEELEYVPAQIFVQKHIYPKYGPCSCEQSFTEEKPEVISAPTAKRILPGSIASDGLLAYVYTAKFCDAIPFYRQSKIFGRIEVNISRATMCNWQMTTHESMSVFFDVLKETLKSGEFIRMDETRVQVLHEDNRDPASKSYMWVAVGYPARGRPLVLYEYHPTRAGHVPMQFLKGFAGYLQTDGYAAYNSPAAAHGIIQVGCFAHARREFFEAYDAKFKNSLAHNGLTIIRKIYAIESDLRAQQLDDDIFVEKRRLAVTPVLDELHAFLVRTKEIAVPSSLVAKAVNYTLNEWGKLIRYLDLACMTPDNNEIERIIKSFVIGRKNWLFSNTPRGAHASAGMYSIIESAKANGLDPYAYLRFLFSKYPQVCHDKEAVHKLLPCFLSPADVKTAE
jgi:transposase